MSGLKGSASGGFNAEDDFDSVYDIARSSLGVGGASAGAGSAASLGTGVSPDIEAVVKYFADLLTLKPHECKDSPVDEAKFAKHLDVLADNGIDFTHSFRPLCTERYRGLLPDGVYEKLLSRSQSTIILITLIADVLGNEHSRDSNFLLESVFGCELPESFDKSPLADQRFCGFNVLHLAVSNLNSDAAVLYLKGLIEIFPGLMTVKRERFECAPTPLELLQSLAHNNAGLPGSKYAQQVLCFYVEYLQNQLSEQAKLCVDVKATLELKTVEVEKYKADSAAAELLRQSGSGAGAGRKKKKKTKRGQKAPRAKTPETDAASHTTEADEHRSALAEKNAVIKRLESSLVQVKSELRCALEGARRTSVKIGTKNASTISNLKHELSNLKKSNQGLETTNSKLVTRLENLKTELAKSIREKVDLAMKLDKAITQRPAAINLREVAASKALAKSKKQIAGLVGKIDNLNSEIARLKAQLAEVVSSGAELAEAQACLKVQKVRGSVFVSEITNLNKWIVVLNAQIQFLQNILIGEQANRVGLESFNTRLQQAYSSLARTHDSLKCQVRPPLPPEPPSADAAASAKPLAPVVAALFKKAKEKVPEGSDDAAAGSASP